ncbi:hypothetical protein [Pelagibacterium sp.]|uniref:hypothetical protein n=1 Tax=Pelagibacterium sp. TaxID=1967288 RepID=UPI003A9502BE
MAVRSLSVADSATEVGTFTNIGVNESMKVVDDGHVVIDSNVPMAKFIGSVSASSVAANFPNFSQDLNVFWNASFIGGVTWGTGFSVHSTWVPQQWENNVVVATGLPSAANFVVGRVRATRIAAPAQIGGAASANAGDTGPWTIVTPSSGFRDISVTTPTGSWVSANGTLTLETSYMMRRTATFRLSGSNLVLSLQQSVGGYSTTPYRGNRNEDFGNYNTEVLARLHRVGARITEGGSSAPPAGWGSGGTYDPRGGYNWASQWRFDVEFLIGHV